MPEKERENQTTQFLAALTELSLAHGLGLAVGVPQQPANLFVLERDSCDDFTRTYKIDAEIGFFSIDRLGLGQPDTQARVWAARYLERSLNTRICA